MPHKRIHLEMCNFFLVESYKCKLSSCLIIVTGNHNYEDMYNCLLGIMYLSTIRSDFTDLVYDLKFIFFYCYNMCQSKFIQEFYLSFVESVGLRTFNFQGQSVL